MLVMMEQFTFHGPLEIEDVARALEGEFASGNLKVQVHGDEDFQVVQIASIRRPASGGRTALTVHLSKIEDGIYVKMGQQEWMGIAASLGQTALGMLKNPVYLLGRLDDLAEDLSSLQLNDRVRETIERVAQTVGASYQISETLRRLTCIYCLTANPVGEPHCVACGAPMGPSQPISCPHCGFVTHAGADQCPQCGKAIH
jgi:hypothetical protein